MIDFRRLQEAVQRVAEHPDFPGRWDIIRECLDELEEYSDRGILTPQQRAQLAARLMMPTASSPPGH